MRAPALVRLIIVAAVGSLSAACSTSGFSHFNPFDGDPGGPPPAPRMWDGSYAGDNPGPDPYSDAGYGEGRVTRTETASNERITRAPKPAKGSRDGNYGTDRIEASELPPPGEYREAPRDEARETYREPEPSYPQERRAEGSGHADRTLTTSGGKQTAAAELSSHKVKSGEELSDVADAYGVREVDIIKLNALKPPYTLKAGQNLKIPGRVKAEAPREGEYVKAGDAAVPQPKPAKGKPAKNEPAPTETASAEGPAFDWPVSGKVVSGFGSGKDGLTNEGINIAVAAGTPVKAAASGTVRYAGNELRGYGNLVLIEHSGGYVTAYAHNQALTVKRGDKVKRGEVIARSGKTGNVTSPQLHFEIRKGTKSIDPKKMLVARR